MGLDCLQIGLAHPTRDPESRPAQLRHSLGDIHSHARSSDTSLLICLVKQGLLVLHPGTVFISRSLKWWAAFRLWINNNNGPSANRRPLIALDPAPNIWTFDTLISNSFTCDLCNSHHPLDRLKFVPGLGKRSSPSPW